MSVTAPTKPRDPTTGGGGGGGSTWDSSSSSGQGTSFTDPQSVWGGQSEYLQGLYQQGAGMFGAGGMDQQGQAGAQGVYNQAMGGFNQMMNPGVNPMLDQYSEAVGRNFDRNIMPGIQGEAAGFGQMGGARQGVAQGIAAGEARQQIGDFAGQQYNNDRNRQMQAMGMAPGLAQFGQSIPWYGMQQYAGLLGDPTVLGGASGSQYTNQSSSIGGSVTDPTLPTTGGGGGGGGGGVGLW